MTKSVCISVTNTLQIIDGPTQNSKLIEGYAQKKLQKYSEIFSISRRSLPRLTHALYWKSIDNLHLFYSVVQWFIPKKLPCIEK